MVEAPILSRARGQGKPAKPGRFPVLGSRPIELIAERVDL
jgi:hypothetical protein